jgi:hypothetical protein
VPIFSATWQIIFSQIFLLITSNDTTQVFKLLKFHHKLLKISVELSPLGHTGVQQGHPFQIIKRMVI